MKQNNNTIIAITGGIGSGKSFVRNILEKKGEICLDCDKINAELLENDKYIHGLSKIFPEAVANNKVDKKILKNIIFNSEENRKKLNAYAHKEIKIKLIEKLNELKNVRVFIEIPLLNQTDFIDLFNEIWVLISNEEKKIERIISRDQTSKDFAMSQIRAQNNNYNFNKKTIFIENNGSIEELTLKIHKLLK